MKHRECFQVRIVVFHGGQGAHVLEADYADQCHDVQGRASGMGRGGI